MKLKDRVAFALGTFFVVTALTCAIVGSTRADNFMYACMWLIFLSAGSVFLALSFEEEK